MSFCPSCGKPVDDNTTFCPNCGYDVQSGRQGVPVPGGAPAMSTPMIRQRPAGVTILAILEMLGGVMVFLLGILIFSLVELAKATFAPEMGVLAGVTMGVVGGFFLVIGLIGIGLGYGLWRGMGWAWTAGLIFAVLGALGGLLALPYGIAGLLIEVAILYYLTRPHVKLYFGK